MAALGWDQGQVYSTAAVPGQAQVNSHSEITSLFYSFIQNYRLNNNFIYRYNTHRNPPFFILTDSFSQRSTSRECVDKAIFYRS